MKKEKVFEYFMVSLFAVGAAIFEKYTNEKQIKEDSKDLIAEEVTKQLEEHYKQER